MNKKLTRTLAGAMSLMFMGQVMIFGDGSAQGLLHADTIASAAEAIEGAKNKDQLAKEFEEATKDLGKVDFFDVPEAVNQNVMAYNSTEVQTEAASDFTWDGTAKSYIQYLKELSGSQDAATLTVTGKVQKGTVDGYATSDNTPIYVRIFNGNWEEIAYQEISDGGEYTVTAGGSDAYHVKFECDGYLPFYLKDFGTGAYQIGSGKSWDTVTLVPGDTTWNEENDNQWSDDVLNSSDVSYVESCRNAYRGDPGFNPSMDHDGDGIVGDADWDYFYRLYEELGEDEFYDMNQLDIYQYDLDNNGVINYYDLQLKQKDTGATEAELADFASVVKSARDYESPAFVYNHYYTNDGKVDAEDYNEGIDKINEQIKLRDRSSNYYEYMDKDNSGIIDDFDINWFSDAQPETGSLDWDHAFKRNLKMLSGGMFPYSFNLHDTNFDLNGCILYVADCMSFTTDMPQFWSGNGATLNINSGVLLIENNLVFRTASPDEWSGKAGQLMNLNGGAVLIGNCFDFGQANCYDTIEMTNSDDTLMVGGNWTYITLTDMEGKWTAGNIWFLGPT